MKTKKQQGFTLVEIIISLVLMSIISLFILYTFTGQYVMLKNTKNITSNTFLSIKEVEKEIQKIKQNIRKVRDNTAPSTVLPPVKEITIFSSAPVAYRRKIRYYEVKNQIGSSVNEVATLVGDVLLTEMKAPEIASVATNFKKGTTLLTNFYSYFFTNMSLETSESQIEVILDGNTNPNDDFMTAKYQWYMSRKGYNTPGDPSDPDSFMEEGELGTTIPLFPGGFKIISGEQRDTYSPIEAQAAGRFLTLGVSPVAFTGKIGFEVNSMPYRYIQGLRTDLINISNYLFVSHLDANLINIKDTTTQVKKEQDENGENKFYVKQLIDTSVDAALTSTNSTDPASRFNNNVAQSKGTIEPQLTYGKTGVVRVNGENKDIYSRYVSFGKRSMLEFKKLTSVSSTDINRQLVTVFVVVRSRNGENENIISKYYGPQTEWHLDFEGINVSGSSTAKQNIESPKSVDKNWHVIGFTIDTAFDKLKYVIDKEEIIEKPLPFDLTMPVVPIQIANNYRGVNYSNIDVAEVVVFTPLPSDKMLEVRDYLYEKYIYTTDKVRRIK